MSIPLDIKTTEMQNRSERQTFSVVYMNTLVIIKSATKKVEIDCFLGHSMLFFLVLIFSLFHFPFNRKNQTNANRFQSTCKLFGSITVLLFMFQISTFSFIIVQNTQSERDDKWMIQKKDGLNVDRKYWDHKTISISQSL